MSKQLQDLMFLIRQHPAFPELLKAVEAPEPKTYSPGKAAGIAEQQAEWIFRSGRKQQHELWRTFLTESPSSVEDFRNLRKQEHP